MLKKISVLVILVVAVLGYVFTIGPGHISSVSPLEENHFPALAGIDLNGDSFAFPDSFTAPLNLVIVAFERDQQKDVNTWISVADTLMESNKDLKFYEVPLIYEINMPYRFWINNGMRMGIPDEKSRKRTITVYTDRTKFTGLMKMETTSIYALLLNHEGKILWQASGTATKQNVSALNTVLKQIRNP